MRERAGVDATGTVSPRCVK